MLLSLDWVRKLILVLLIVPLAVFGAILKRDGKKDRLSYQFPLGNALHFVTILLLIIFIVGDIYARNGGFIVYYIALGLAGVCYIVFLGIYLHFRKHKKIND